MGTFIQLLSSFHVPVFMNDLLKQLSKNRVNRRKRMNEDVLAVDPVSVFEPIVVGTYKLADIEQIKNSIARYNDNRSDATPNFPELVFVGDEEAMTDSIRVMVRVMTPTALTNQEISQIVRYMLESVKVSAISESAINIKYADDLARIIQAEDIHRVTPYPNGDFAALLKQAYIPWVSSNPISGTLYLQGDHLFFVTEDGKTVSCPNEVHSFDDIAVELNPICSRNEY